LLVLSGLGCTTSKELARNPQVPAAEPVAGTEASPPTAEEQPNVAIDDSSTTEESVTISLDQVATELGMPKERLRSQAQILANFIDTRRSPQNLCGDEDRETNSKLCETIAALRDNPNTNAQNSRAGRRVPIRPHHFVNQQGMNFERLMRSISREPASRIMVWAPRMLETTSCPRNLSAASIRRLEGLLPSRAAAGMMERLYEHASACLRPEDEGYELTHLRQALLRRLWGNDEGARLSISRAVLATESREKSRVLFWAGRLANQPKVRERHWNRLVDDFPLSFHALEVWHERGMDPMTIIGQRPNLNLNRRVQQNDSVDQAVRWLEALYILGRVEAAQKYTRWIARHYRGEITPSNLLYISSLKSNRGTPLNTITFLTRQVSENPVILNQQTLQMLFPKPFFDTFDRHASASETDTFLVLAVARQESGFNPTARSPANARGLLQILPSTARILSGKRNNNLYDSELNARLGTKFLGQLINRFGSVEKALMGYNAGPGRVPDWEARFPTQDMSLFMDLVPFYETRNYVAAILRNNYWYERVYSEHPSTVAKRAIASNSKRSSLVQRYIASHKASSDRPTTSAR
jgi:soluble lytic murein transglycosylase